MRFLGAAFWMLYTIIVTILVAALVLALILYVGAHTTTVPY